MYIELFESPPSSLILLLEEACCFARGDDKSFLEKALTSHAKGKLLRNAGHKHKMTAFFIPSKSESEIFKFVAMLAVPAFPGATKSLFNKLLDAIL
jgi:hypothetical protein